MALLIQGCQFQLLAQGRHGSLLPDGLFKVTTSYKGYLYQGIDNYIEVDSQVFYRAEIVELEGNNGLVVKDTSNRFLVLPERAGKLRLNMIALSKEDTIMQGYRYFNVKYIPEPLLSFNGIPHPAETQISKSELLLCDSLTVYFNNDIPGSELWLLVTGFELGYNYGGLYVSHQNPSNRFSAETLQVINNLGPDHDISIKVDVEGTGKFRKQLPIYRIKLY